VPLCRNEIRIDERRKQYPDSKHLAHAIGSLLLCGLPVKATRGQGIPAETITVRTAFNRIVVVIGKSASKRMRFQQGWDIQTAQ
jgi:transcriptional regulator of met regulon